MIPCCPHCRAPLAVIWINTKLKIEHCADPYPGPNDDYHFTWQEDHWEDPVSTIIELVGDFVCRSCGGALFSLQEATITIIDPNPYDHLRPITWERWRVSPPAHFLMESLL